MNLELLEKAYTLGKQQGSSLSFDYFKSSDGKTIFIRNPNDQGGRCIGKQQGYFQQCPENFIQFDMYEARN